VFTLKERNEVIFFDIYDPSTFAFNCSQLFNVYTFITVKQNDELNPRGVLIYSIQHGFRQHVPNWGVQNIQPRTWI